MTQVPPAIAPAADLERKAATLDARLAALGSVLIAYSGGIDSAFLAVTATKLLGPRALCITADSPSYPDRHRNLAIGTARTFRPRPAPRAARRRPAADRHRDRGLVGRRPRPPVRDGGAG